MNVSKTKTLPFNFFNVMIDKMFDDESGLFTFFGTFSIECFGDSFYCRRKILYTDYILMFSANIFPLISKSDLKETNKQSYSFF